MKNRLLIRFMGLILLTVIVTGCGINWKSKGGSSEDLSKAKEEKLYTDGNTKYLFRTKGKEFQKYNGKKFENYYIKGVNLGTSKPNFFPGELGLTEDEYLKWFEQIGGMHANTIRVYTVLMPAFYNALYYYNTTHDEKIYLFQGCWYNEEVISKTHDAYSDIKDVKKDLKNLVDIIHGKADVKKSYGHAYGTYTKDVSKYVAGWILGIESDQEIVEGTKKANKKKVSYSGKYLSCKNVQPYEVFWCEIGDYALKYEDEKYNMQRPISYSNWPTADVMKHPNEPYSKEDAVSLTVDDLNAKKKLKTGIFASYHVYSYYPNFMFSDEAYSSYKDKNGKKDTYYAYLKDLVAHNDCPVVIAEFGIPASRGVTHINPITGFNQGGVSAKKQGEMLVSMFKDIKKAKCAGGIIFVWEDEWFKRTWNTMKWTNSDYRSYWNDVQTSEQHFGIAEYISTECDPIPVLDGKLDDWNKEDLIFEKNTAKVYAKCDSTYLYVAIDDEKADFNKKGNNIYFDINPMEGCKNYGNVKLSSEADFILHIEGKDKTRMLAEETSDTYIRTEYDWKKLDLKQDKNDTFHRMYMITDYSLKYPKENKVLPVQKSETGLLHYGKVDVDNEIGDVTTDFYYKDHVFEVRVPWGLLGFSAPSVKEINYAKKDKKITVPGINIGYISEDKNLGEKQFAWENWERASYRYHLRQSYYIIQDYLKTIK